MKRLIVAVTLTLALSGCQGIVGVNGQVTGVTVPPGCKGSITFSYPMPQGAIMLECDETKAAAIAPHALVASPGVVAVPLVGAHIVIDRQ